MADGDEVQFQSPTSGKIQAVPPEHWDEAIKQGYKPTTHSVMYSPDGQRGMVPNSERYAKTQAGFTDAPKTQVEKDRPGKGISLEGSGGAAWDVAKQIPSGLLRLVDPTQGLSGAALTKLGVNPRSGSVADRMDEVPILGAAREARAGWERGKAAESGPQSGVVPGGTLDNRFSRAILGAAGSLVGVSAEQQAQEAERGEGGKILGQAAVPAALAVAPEVLGPLSKLGPKMAPKLANRVLRPVPTQIENAARFGRDPGQAIATEGIVATSHEDLVSKIAAKKEEVGQLIDDALQNSKATPKNVAMHIQKPINDMIQAAADGKVEGGEALIGKLQELRNQYMTKRVLQPDGSLKIMGPKKLTLSPVEMHALKRQIGDATTWHGAEFEDSLNQVKADMYRNLNEEIKTGTSSVEPLQDRYGNLLEARKAAIREAARHAARNPFSILDVGAGGIGGILGMGHSPELGAALAVGLPAARHIAQSVPTRTLAVRGLQVSPDIAAAARGGRATLPLTLGRKRESDQILGSQRPQ